MKIAILYGLGLLICLQGVGCTSIHVIEKAQGTPPKREDAKPAYYLLLPLSAPLDVALVTVGGIFFLWAWSESNGSSDDYSVADSSDSSKDKGGLKVKRP